MKSEHNILTLFATSFMSFMQLLDASIVNVAIPSLTKDLNVPMNRAEWIVSVYLIMICMLLLFWGRMADQIGYIKIFQMGTIFFTIGSLICALSPSLSILLFGRIVQGIGASMSMATNIGIIAMIFPMSQRGRAYGINSIIAQLGNISGPGLGGLILGVLSWHWIFIINIPIGIIVYIYGRFMFPKEHRRVKTISYDWTGLITYSIAIATFFVGIFMGQDVGFLNKVVLLTFAVSVVFWLLFFYVEEHIKSPLIDLKIFKIPRLTLSLVSALIVFSVGYYANVIMPFYLTDFRSLSTSLTGLIMMAIPFANVIAAPIAGYFTDKYNAASVSIFNLFIYAIPIIFLIWVSGNDNLILFTFMLLFLGIGNGGFQNNPMIMGYAPQKYQGIAGSLAALFRNLGMGIGVSIATTSLYYGMSVKAGKNIADYPSKHPNWFLSGMHFAYMTALVLLLIAIVLVYMIHRIDKKENN
ncbi:MFS transporter [Companilactobacillus alimentarius]|uniref:MFS transporter n=2 Tax=Companilactobacillus alimentarius TaxID=1602 RepID=A0A2K9HJ21_9LACO|nr:MFS transporter [Companilactobacillus alimentarius]AUI72529.1 MFS transporter [Companilactobacillus alimentarius DSM 20249]GEO45061.1 MFS transporter [Companilactobacillus alimentarius]